MGTICGDLLNVCLCRVGGAPGHGRAKTLRFRAPRWAVFERCMGHALRSAMQLLYSTLLGVLDTSGALIGLFGHQRGRVDWPLSLPARSGPSKRRGQTAAERASTGGSVGYHWKYPARFTREELIPAEWSSGENTRPRHEPKPMSNPSYRTTMRWGRTFSQIDANTTSFSCPSPPSRSTPASTAADT